MAKRFEKKKDDIDEILKEAPKNEPLCFNCKSQPQCPMGCGHTKDGNIVNCSKFVKG